MVEVLWLLLKVFGAAVIIDTVLYLGIWRARVHNRNIARRQKESSARKTKIRDDIFWSLEGQEELYRDFERAN